MQHGRSTDWIEGFVLGLIESSDLVGYVRAAGQELGREELSALKAWVDRQSTVNFHSARRIADAIKLMAEMSGDSYGKAVAAAARGRVEYCLGSYENAYKYYSRAICGMEELGEQREAAIYKKQQIGVLMYLGRHKELLELAASARKVLSREGLEEQLAELETNIGNFHSYLLGQHRRALTHYRRARDIFQRLGMQASLARVEHNTANALTHLDRIEEALALYRNAIEIYSHYQMNVLKGQASYNAAYLLFRQGRYHEALQDYYRVRAEQQQLGDTVSVAWCNMDMAEIYLHLLVYEESVRLATEAEQSFLASGNTSSAEWARTVGGLAIAGLGEIAEARRRLRAALQSYSKQGAEVMTGLVHAYLTDLELAAGEYRAAQQHALEAERIFICQKLWLKATCIRLKLARIALLCGEYEKMQLLLGKLRRRSYSLPHLRSEYLYLRGCLYQARGKNAKALVVFDEAIQIVDSIRARLHSDELRSGFLSDKIDLLERATDLALASDIPRSLDYIERAKSRSLAELLSHYINRELAGRLVSEELKQRYQALLDELNWHTTQQQSHRSEASLLKERLRCERELAEIYRRIQSEEFTELCSHVPVDLEQVRGRLEEGEQIVEYFAIGGKLSAIVLGRDSLRQVRNLATLAQVEDLIEGFQFQIGKFQIGSEYVERHWKRMQTDVNHYLERFYRLLFEPLELELKSPLSIIPHGLLHYLPFHALYDGSCYLLERCDVSYAPSLRVWSLCRGERPQVEGSLVVLGLADEAAPEILAEARALATVAPEARLLLGSDATITNLKQYGPQARYLHLATHGQIRPDNPLFSSLKLADGELSFYNTFDLGLQAELVTLAACHTGVNRIFPGDELQGLSRGFLYAGSPAIVVSLWGTDDCATAKLMSSFYTHLYDGKSHRAALCAAEREMLSLYLHPYYWAAFILLGLP